MDSSVISSHLFSAVPHGMGLEVLLGTGWSGSTGEPAPGVVEAAGDRPVDDVVTDLDPDAADDRGVDDDVEVDLSTVRPRQRGGQPLAVGVGQRAGDVHRRYAL